MNLDIIKQYLIITFFSKKQLKDNTQKMKRCDYLY